MNQQQTWIPAAQEPQRHQSTELSFGTAHVFYPEASSTRCTVAVLVEVDPVDLVRNRKGRPVASRRSPIRERPPYAASSHLSAALNKFFNTTMSGRCKERPELVDVTMPFEVWLPHFL